MTEDPAGIVAGRVGLDAVSAERLDACEPLPDYGYEPVLLESDWYDGPRSGLARVHGVLRYFESDFVDIQPGRPEDVFHVWPAAPEAVEWEREQWAIFADWNHRREAGETTTDTHPGHGGIDVRYDELQSLLQPHRVAPEDAQRFHVQWRFTQTGHRYHRDGVDYEGLWTRYDAHLSAEVQCEGPAPGAGDEEDSGV